MRISIIGGGNIGTLLAASFAHKGNEVIIHSSRPEKFRKELEVYDRHDRLLYTGRIALATSDWKEAVKDADLIWVTVPPQLFKATAEAIEPYTKKGQMIGIIPGAGGAEFAFHPLIEKGLDFFGIARVPSIARLKEYGKSSCLLGPAPEILVGSIPASKARKICTKIQPLYSMPCKPVPNYLNIAFTPSNPVLHTSRLYSLFKDYVPGNHYPVNELFYENWSIDSAEVLLQCSDELQAVCKAIPLDLRNVESMQERHHIRTAKELSEKICSLERLKGLYSPVIKEEAGYVPDFHSRYFVSDFPLGIRIMMETARLFAVPVPMMETIWAWYEKVCPEEAEQAFSLNMSKEQFIDFYA